MLTDCHPPPPPPSLPPPPPPPLPKLTYISLHPGEVLYIPPYWIIHSEAITLSIIIDVLSLSKEQDLLMPAYHMSLPFHSMNIKTKEARIVSAQVCLLISTCFIFFENT